MKKKNYNIALTQISLDGTPDVNLKKCLEWIRKAAAQGANVVCLPELYSSFYFCQSENHDYFEWAEPLHNDSYKAFSALAAELGIVLIVPFFERRASGLYHNSAYIINTDGSQAGLYRKMHIPDDPSYYEKFYFTPGDIGFKAFDTQVGKIGTLICWDQWYPEEPGLPPFKAPMFSSTQRPLDGTLTKRRNTAKNNTMPGAPFSEDMP